MEAATKNKRGRPAKHATTYTVFPEMEKRTAANMIYAMRFIRDAMEETPGNPNNFFITPIGNIKRQGIAEQIGRMMEAELITTDEAKELGTTSINLYNDGYSVKAIEKWLRCLRLEIQKKGEA